MALSTQLKEKERKATKRLL